MTTTPIDGSTNIFGTSDTVYAITPGHNGTDVGMMFTNGDTISTAGTLFNFLSLNFDTNPTVDLSNSAGDFLSVWQLRGTLTITDFNRTDTLCLRSCGLTTAQAKAGIHAISPTEQALTLPAGGQIIFDHATPSPINVYTV